VVNLPSRSRSRFFPSLLFSLPLLCPPPAQALAAAPPPPEFARDVRPILERRCIGCHGPEKSSGGLRLDTREEALKGGKKGEDIVPGKAAESRLILLVRGESKPRMPPKGDPLAPAEIDVIARWIDAGALPSATPGSSEPEGASRSSSTPSATAAPAVLRLPWREQPVLALAASRDGSLLACAQGEAVVVRAFPGGAPRGVVLTGGPFVTSVAIHPEARFLAAGGRGEVRLHGMEGGSPTAEPSRVLGPHAGRVQSLAFSRDGALLFAGAGIPSRGGELEVWETATGSLVRTIAEHADTVLAVAVSPDGAHVVTASADRMIHIHEIASGKRIRRYMGHSHHVNSVSFSPDGRSLVSGGSDREVKLWNIERPLPTRTIAGHEGEVYGALFLPDGTRVVSASADRTVRIWSAGDGKLERTFGGEAADQIYTLALLDEGKLVASAGRDRTVRIHETATGKLVASLPPPPEDAEAPSGTEF